MVSGLTFVLGTIIFTMACAVLKTSIAYLAIYGRFTVRLLLWMATAVCVIAAFLAARF